jgi:hypothetical protein
VKALSQHLNFKPHGERLLTSSAAFWLFSARVLVLAMASAEALAWGYLGFILMQGPWRWLSAGFVSVTIFIVVWMIDISLITMDRSWAEHAVSILGESHKRGGHIRDAFTLTIRIGLLVGSLSITAPYLAQLVFYRDISHFNARVGAAQIDSARNTLLEKYDSAIAQSDSAIERRRAEYEHEVAGIGPSRRFGSGPTAQAINRAVGQLQRDREDLAQRRDAELRRFNALARNPELNRDQISASYGIILPEGTVLGNSAVLRKLRERPEYKQTELAIQAFLAFIFIGLLLLKLFEPYSVRLYFSDVLQQEYTRYQMGAFDEVLPPTERSSNGQGAISAQRLYHFLSRVWTPARLLEEAQAISQAHIAAAVIELKRVEQMRDEAASELKRKKEEVIAIAKLRDTAALTATQLSSAVKTVQSDVNSYEDRLVALSTRPETLDELGWKEHRTTVTRELARAKDKLRELLEQVPTVEDENKRRETELTQSESAICDKYEEVQQLEAKVRALREHLADATNTRARLVLTAE